MAGEKIIMVDDEIDVLDLCKRILEVKGYQVTTARDGHQVVEFVKQEHFDLLLTDIRMPGMSGLEVAQAVKQFAPNIICVVMTGFSTMDMAIEALKLGIDEFIMKPFSPDELNMIVSKAFEKGRLRREIFRFRSLIPLFELNKSLMSATGVEETLRDLLEIFKKEVNADFAKFCTCENNRFIFHFQGEKDKESKLQWQASNELIKFTFENGQQLSINRKSTTNSEYRAILEQLGMQSVIATPLKFRDSNFGAFILARKESDFSPSDHDFLAIFSIQVGIAMEALKLRIDEFLAKPLTSEELSLITSKTLEVKRLSNQVEELRRERADLHRQLNENEKQLEQLRRERDELTDQLQKAREKQATKTSKGQFPLAELSRLTDGIVHDMRNGIGIIRNTLGFLEDDLGDNTHRAELFRISRSLDFCELVLRNLSALGEQDIFQPKWVNVETIVREVYFLLERKLVDVELVMDIDPNAPQILADEGQIRQVFMNLIKNAGEAMPDGGTLTCRTQYEGEKIRIEVSDTGWGISSKNLARLFQKFFTTKKRGYGLGLHIVHTIIKRHKGTIAVKSKLGVGTTFTLYLPIKPD